MRAITGYLLVIALLAVIPFGIARHMLSQSRPAAFVEDQPNYLAHVLPPSDINELSDRLAGILDKEMHQMQSVPRVYLSRLPVVLPEIGDARLKKRLFTSALLPIILRANELVIADRQRLLIIKSKLDAGRSMRKAEQKWLAATASQYRLTIDQSNVSNTVTTLLHNIDIIPASLALAQGAMETGWGTSKFAQKGNALFGEWVWGDDAQGIVPSGREEGKTHKVKSFDYLLDSVRSYMLNLNRHRSYKGLRERRAELRSHSLTVTGAALAPALIDYSQRGDEYVNDILSIINYNGFDALDHALLAKL